MARPGGLPATVDMILAPHGFKRILPRLAGRGDLVAVRTAVDVGLGVHLGHLVVALSSAGFAWLRPGAVRVAWKID